MKIIYSDQEITGFAKSIFLAGPTPRSDDVPSWRDEAIEILRTFSFDGIVFVPERSNHKSSHHYYDQIAWEWKALDGCTLILFWVPRDMKNMPALTTNIEFGRYTAIRPESVLYGRPDWAEHVRYLDKLYSETTGMLPHNALADLIARGLLFLKGKK
jgi:hypothetical protein